MDKYPLEKYILSTLKKCHYNIDVSVQAINAKYPFFKEKDLRSIIADLFVKKINNYKIGGKWECVEKKWKLVGEGPGYSWSGPELPASEDTSSMDRGKNTYSTPGDRPDGKTPKVKKHEEIKTIDYDGEEDDTQKTYNELYDQFSNSVDSDDDLNKIILDELVERGYGKKRIDNIQLKKRQ